MTVIQDNLNVQVILVDTQDNAIGSASKLLAHQQGLLHRAFSIFVFRQCTAGIEILLQQRAAHKYHSAGLWTNTCCSHPAPHETILDAAKKRLLEECGFSTPVEYAGSFTYYAPVSNNYIEHELDHVLVGQYQSSADIAYNPQEIQQIKWLELQRLKVELQHKPNNFTPWFQAALLVASQFCNWP